MSQDNAGRGLRGTRAAVSAALISLLQHEYGFAQIEECIDLGGSSNLNLCFRCREGQFIARVYRPYVSAGRLQAIQTTREHLNRGGIPCARLVNTQNGGGLATLDGRMVEVENFVPSDTAMDTPEKIAAAMPWMGRMHGLLAELPEDAEADMPLFANHIEPADVLKGVARGIARVHAWNPSSSELALCNMVEEAARQVVQAEHPYLPALRRQRTHGDFWDNNVFFQDEKVVLIADFDYMGRSARTDDLARTLYFATASVWTKQDENRILRFACALAEAYNSTASPQLNRIERMSLPAAIARQPLWWAGRWLPTLDNQALAREGFAGMQQEIEISHCILNNLQKWQTAFTS